MSDELHVWFYPPDALKPRHCGTLRLIGGRRCLFSYARSWLADPHAIELSPDLPLRPGEFEPEQGQDLHPIFDDAGPDRWGRRVIDVAFPPPRRSPIDYLALAGEDRIGAFGFSWSFEHYAVPDDQAFHAADLDALAKAAHAIEVHDPIDERLRRLLQPGRSVGGARPKAIIQDAGRYWIAKFAAEGDTIDVSAVEYASLRLAQMCGIDVPDSRLVSIRGRNMLLVERFDRTPTGHRRHLASGRTMLIAEGIDMSAAGYADLAEIARRYSPQPREDSLQLFRRMIFNVLMENTDDHEKNHAFLNHAGKWKLSPAYDLQPQIQGIGYQQLVVGAHAHEPSIGNALSDAGRFMLTAREANAEMERLVEILSRWPDAFRAAGVSERDIETCARFVLLERERDATYGRVPEAAVAPDITEGHYVGDVIAVRPNTVFQNAGDGAAIAHSRASLNSTDELGVGSKIDITYKNGSVQIARLDRKPRTKPKV
jgi:serine/threonine-protein kinase HipA